MRITINSPVDAPSGLQYAPEFLAKEEQADLISRLENLDWDSAGLFKRRGKIVKRREIDFIHDYGRHSRTLSEGPPLPQFLQPLRAQCAAALDLEPDDFQQVICSLYRPGAGIDWHIDSLKAFGDTICGISLASECVMRFRRRRDDKPWRLKLSPGSLLILRGSARYEFQHQIPAVKDTRYSITFRTLLA